MSDLIDRRMAIGVLLGCTEHKGRIQFDKAVAGINKLPPANNSETPNSSDTISRQAVKDILDKYQLRYHIYPYVWDAINELPPAQPEPPEECERCMMEHTDEMEKLEAELAMAQPKRGRWISADAMFGGVPFYCSECGENTRDTVMGKPRWNFCPNCGAKMEVTE